ncbi:hypothetical protein EHF33_05630 [Deinococcus psychrotolerans]|uniref:Uncharacterized protein n=1 Tax=Deinococcus psychrotolerans TaxID=2489213 RepID=A0A3G8YMB5_9DEIO|nr:hypothetical protein [Deinococcus psychrotolerans]AZI42296.1 hypothetical protein EHF33_05630 [Deinococcus psychrotolerans]
MLSQEEKRQILAEETALADAERSEQRRVAHQQAQAAYRAEVRAAQRAGPTRWGWLLAGLVVWAGASAVFLVFRQPAAPDDLSGGVASSALIERCKHELLNQLGQLAAQFPADAEAAQQITANTDGKRWDGWVESSSNFSGRAEFSCQYNPPTDTVEAQIIR